jgi:flagellar protein FlaJ
MILKKALKGDASGAPDPTLKAKKKLAMPKRVDDAIVYFTILLFGISTGQIQPSDLMRTAGTTKHYGYYSDTFMKIHMLGVKWQYGLAKACEVVAADTKGEDFKLLLMKLAQVLRLGEELSVFFKQELDAVMSGFSSTYERSMRSMDMLLEMYSTMMSTSSFLVSSMALLTMISGSGGDSSQLVVTVTFAILLGLISFVLMAYFLFPTDRLMLNNDHPDVARIKKKLMMSIGIGAGAGVAIGFIGVIPIPLVISIAGAPLILPGLMAQKLDGKIRKLDDYYPAFVRHLGDVYATVGSLGASLKSVLRSDFGVLSPHIAAMANRVSSRIKIEDAFDYFSQDTGSVLIGAGNTTMSNAMVKGANMMEVGTKLSEITMKFLEMRRKRLQSARAFETTIIIMHVLTLAVFSLINRLLQFLTEYFAMQSTITENGTNLIPINPGDGALVGMILPALAIALAAINAMALKVSQGGFFHTIWFNMAILMILGGIVTYGVDVFLEQMIGEVLDIDSLVEGSIDAPA